MKTFLKSLIAILALKSSAYASDIDVKKAFEIINNQDVTVIDVRTPEEYAQAHINGSLNINLYDNKFQDEIKLLDKSKKYVIYCRSGRRSATAEKMFNDLGIKDTFNIEGGIIDWQKKGLPVVK